MPAPRGNTYYKIRTKHGRPLIFPDPEQLWEAACSYFDWVSDNPLIEEKHFYHKGEVIRVHVNKMRAMCLEGLCLHLKIGRSTWRDYTFREDFSTVTTRVESVIWVWNFDGAVADLLNPCIVARTLGLKDRKDYSTERRHGGLKINYGL